MVSGRVFYSAVMGDASFLIVKLSDREKFGIVAFKKQLSQYMEKTGLNVAFCFDDITRVQRDALIAKEIPFVSLPDQIFLPFLGVMLSNNLKRKMIVSTDKMMPATQCLFLYLLYKSGNDFFIKKQAADDLGLTKMLYFAIIMRSEHKKPTCRDEASCMRVPSPHPDVPCVDAGNRVVLLFA